MSITYKPVMKESMAKQIAEQIRASIINGRLKADDRLPTESGLAGQFGVSRPTIREALKRLAAQNLIRSRRGPTGGTFVNRPSQKDVQDDLTTASTLLVTLGEFDLSEIADARHELEVLCGRLAAERGEAHDLDAMAREIEFQKQEHVGDEEFCASDVRFHRALVNATRNPVLQFVMSCVIEALQPVENMVIFRFRDRRKIISQHERILAALKTGNADKTEKAITEQMNYLRELFARAQEWRRERDEAGDAEESEA